MPFFYLISNYKHNPQHIDLFMTNLFSMNVYKGLSLISGPILFIMIKRVLGKIKIQPGYREGNLLVLGTSESSNRVILSEVERSPFQGSERS